MGPVSEAARRLAAPAVKIVSKSSWLLLLIASLLSGGSAHGQEQPQIDVTVKVVNVFATVRDKHGQIVSESGQG